MVAILIPTLNRPEYVKRQLLFYEKYYSQKQNSRYHSVYVIDSGEADKNRSLKKFVEERNFKFKIKYYSFPKLSFGDSLLKALNDVSEKYVVYVGDDDFFIPSTLDLSAEFLEKNKDYSACRGESLIFTLNEEEPFGTFFDLARYPQPAYEEPVPLKRVKNFFDKYSCTMFAVTRTEIFKNAFTKATSIQNRAFKDEIFPSASIVIAGRVHQLPELGLIRQDHKKRFFLPTPLDWVLLPEWRESFLKTEELISEQLGSSVSKEDIRSAIGLYIKSSLKKLKSLDDKMSQKKRLLEFKTFQIFQRRSLVKIKKTPDFKSFETFIKTPLSLD